MASHLLQRHFFDILLLIFFFCLRQVCKHERIFRKNCSEIIHYLCRKEEQISSRFFYGSMANQLICFRIGSA